MAFPEFEPSSACPLTNPSPWAEPSGREVTPSDVMNALRDLNRRMELFELEISNHRDAYMVNDLGKPDFHGHRNHHRQITESSRLMTNYKNDITKQILTVTVAFVLGLLATGFKEYIVGNPSAASTKSKPA